MRTLLAVLLLLALPASMASGASFVLRAHLASAALGLQTPSLNHGIEADLRFADVAFGPRLSERLAVMGWVTVMDVLPTYNHTTEPFANLTTLGAMVAFCPLKNASMQRLAVTAGVRGCNGWGLNWPGARFIEGSLGVGTTPRFINPSIECGLRHEFSPTSGGSEPPVSVGRDCLWLVVRLGLGGIYEIGR